MAPVRNRRADLLEGFQEDYSAKALRAFWDSFTEVENYRIRFTDLLD